MSNYRPVTTPMEFSKVFEYAFTNRLKFLEDKQVLIENQQGFHNGRSATTAINSFYHEIVKFIEAEECSVGLFCDLSRAFDCVDLKSLLTKLKSYVIYGTALSWIENFLEGRR